jgi:secreted Zn-dependent insulinase-like peptidase
MEIQASDKRAYKHITLSNGLSCVIISDTEQERSAAALAVGVGQMQDDLPGLAHLTEASRAQSRLLL